MSKKRSVPGPEQNWHFDCRLVADLPEDNVVGSRFLVNVLFGSVALVCVLLGGWLAYRDLSLRFEIRDWQGRITENQAMTREIKKAQAEYSVEAAKIDQAFATLKTQLFVTGFNASLGRARPQGMIIDAIESADNAIHVRGSIYESFQNAGTIYNEYLRQLRADATLTPFFDSIRQSALDQARGINNKVNFEITFQRKATGG